MSDAFVVCSHLSFSWPDDTPVFQDLSVSVPGGRTGLVAPNGAGKSTLLKLIAGELQPAGGTITCAGVLGYLPQHLPFMVESGTAGQVLGVDRIIAALHAIESGDVAEDNFSVVGNDWDVEERTRAELDRLGLIDVTLDRPLGTLSGGQVISLGLAAELLRRPDVLLLDEPTNNLDRDARDRLIAVLRSWTGCLIVVSHDRELLDEMDRIAVLDHGEVRWYGGNHSAYELAVGAEQEGAEQRLRTAEQDLKRQRIPAQQARERADRRASTAARNLPDAGLARIHAGNLKRNAQVSAARGAGTHADRVSQAQARADEAGWAARQDARIVVEIPDTTVPAGRTLFHGEQLRSPYGSFAGVDLTVRGPERIALTGPNGTGKSTLLRMIRESGDGRTAYLSQRLDLLDEGRTVAENLAAFAPNLPDAERFLSAININRRLHLASGTLTPK